MLPPEIVEEIVKISIPQASNRLDSLRWVHSPDGRYTPSTAYHTLSDPAAGDFGVWRRIWKLKVPEKIRFFLWLVSHGALPTNAKRFQCHLASSAACPRCAADHEDLDHLFRGCPDSQSLWNVFRAVLPTPAPQIGFGFWFTNLISHRNNTLGIAVLWWMWRWRNHRIFELQGLTMNHVLRCILRDESLWRQTLQCPVQHSVHSEQEVGVISSQKVIVTVDGSWNPQVGRMGCAAVLRNSKGGWVSATSVSYEHGNSFSAELLAVEMGLRHAVEKGFSEVVCLSDCPKVVEVLQPGSIATNYWSLEIIRRVRELMGSFTSINLVRIDRDRNNTADSLAREACRLGSPIQVWSRPPSFVFSSLFMDGFS